MADATFNTTSGQTIARELLILAMNTSATSTPAWSVIGKRVEDSSAEYDWSTESKTDILGQTYTTMRKPIVTQSFDPYELDAGDTAHTKLWNLAVKDQDVSALAALDMLVIHCYAGTADSAMVAERYPASAVEISSIGGSNTVDMPFTVTFGGAREVGTAAISSAGVITYTAPSA